MKIKTLKLSDDNFYQSLKNALSFDEEDNSQIQQTVKDIVQAVKVNGDQALLEFTKKFVYWILRDLYRVLNICVLWKLNI